MGVECWEALALTLARNCEFQTPEFTEYRASSEKSVLVVERFDRTESGHGLGYISAATAMSLGRYDDSRITYEQFADSIAEIRPGRAGTSKKCLDALRSLFSSTMLTTTGGTTAS